MRAGFALRRFGGTGAETRVFSLPDAGRPAFCRRHSDDAEVVPPATPPRLTPGPFRQLPRPIGNDEIGAGTLQTSHDFKDDLAFIDPAALGRGLDHGVFTADVVNGGR